MRRHDYLPFGEEIAGDASWRTGARGYSADSVRQKFTAKERDDETGLDYFEARYFSSAMGRFTSPDEFTGGPDELYDFADDASDNPTFYAELSEPQSLNKYQYSYNNPLRYVDPDGHSPDAPQNPLPLPVPLPPPVVPIPGAPKMPPPPNPVELWWKVDSILLEPWRERGPVLVIRQMLGTSPEVSPEEVPLQNPSPQPVEVVIDANKHPEAARHVEDAQKAGHPDTLTVDRSGARNRRRESLKGTRSRPHKDRDEYPPAATREGGRGASVRHISPRDNRGAGSSMGHQMKNVPDGGKIRVRVVRGKSDPL